MGGIFKIDGKLFRFGTKLTDLMIINLLTLLCCLPIFTIGPALTAMHYVLLRLYRDEEGYIVKNYFKSFKENFKQATLIWLIYLGIIAVVGLDAWVIAKGGLEIPAFIKYALVFVGVLGTFSLTWVFVLQSRYENPIKATIKNSFIVSVANFFKTVMMLIMLLVPALLIFISEATLPIVFFYGFSLPGLLQTMIYSKIFDRMEGVDRDAASGENADDGWTIEEEDDSTEAVTESEENTDVQNDEEMEK